MSYKPSYAKGDWLAICDQCGRQYKASELRLRWDNLMVCSGDWEPRQPQDFVHGVADIMSPPWTRPESSDSFIPFVYTNNFFNSSSTTSSSLSKLFIAYTSSKHELNAKPLNSVTIG
jgi:hypothetical protein